MRRKASWKERKMQTEKTMLNVVEDILKKAKCQEYNKNTMYERVRKPSEKCTEMSEYLHISTRV